ncbi:MAG: type III-A CRISPR-associated protein Cas10/Csm1 [Chloroflexi bacterium]|nr:type III-A CRISPR-associated protein Cas10/Csm1 [Chloroflexota bacterium]
MDERDALTLGALLHDSGKFVIRSEDVVRGKDHSQVGSEWLKGFAGLSPIIAACAQLHHKKYYEELSRSNLSLLVYHSDNLSAASERHEKEGTYDPRNTPLMSIFSKISLDGKGTAGFRFHELRALDGEEILYPKELSELQLGKEAYERLLEGFQRDFSRWTSMDCPFNLLLLILERYWSCVPSETERVEGKLETYPDVSLFDHAKTASAVARCLYNGLLKPGEAELSRGILPVLQSDLSREEVPRFQLIGGDFSGVQRFIYTISSKGALKTLRARSFFLEILTEHAVSLLIRGLGLTRANLIYAGGGRFYLLAQNTLSAREMVERVKARMNNWLYDRFRQRLYLVIEALEVSGRDLKTERISSLWSQLGEQIAKGKGLKFHGRLKDLFSPQEPISQRSCQVCQRDDLKLAPIHPDEPETDFCSDCRRLFDLGDELLDGHYLTVRHIIQREGDLLALPEIDDDAWAYYSLSREIQDGEDYQAVYAFNRWILRDYHHPQCAQLLYSNYSRKVGDLPERARAEEEREIGVGPGATASFHGLAACSTGAHRLGILRIDMDHLGRIFATGLPAGDRTFARLASLSRQLTLFFKHHINLICAGKMGEGLMPFDLTGKRRANAERAVSVVYSGGDDLFVVGAWDDTAELALDIQGAFSRFTGHNPSVTLSGGIVVYPSDFPLYQLAEFAEEAEREAKRQGRDRLALFYTPQQAYKEGKENRNEPVYPWRQMEEKVRRSLGLFLNLAERKEGTVQLKIPRRLIYKLFSLFDQWQQEGVLFLPGMAYTMRRTREALRKEGIEMEWLELERLLMDPQQIGSLRTVLTWIELLSRSEERSREKK